MTRLEVKCDRVVEKAAVDELGECRTDGVRRRGNVARIDRTAATAFEGAGRVACRGVTDELTLGDFSVRGEKENRATGRSSTLCQPPSSRFGEEPPMKFPARPAVTMNPCSRIAAETL